MDASYEIEYITKWVEKLNSTVSASEFHGLITGLIITQGSDAALLWQEFVVPDLDPENEELEAAVDNLSLPLETLIDELNDPMLTFTPLVPEEADQTQRIEAVAEWVQGFLLGLSHGNMQTEKLSIEANDFLEDMLEISRADTFERDSDEEVDEVALTEIVEYIRSGTLLLLDELRPVDVHASSTAIQ